MKKEVTKAPKVALCRMCHGTGRTFKALKPFDPTKEQNCDPCVCPQCEGSGRVTVSAKMEYDIRPYKPKAE